MGRDGGLAAVVGASADPSEAHDDGVVVGPVGVRDSALRMHADGIARLGAQEDVIGREGAARALRQKGRRVRELREEPADRRLATREGVEVARRDRRGRVGAEALVQDAEPVDQSERLTESGRVSAHEEAEGWGVVMRCTLAKRSGQPGRGSTVATGTTRRAASYGSSRTAKRLSGSVDTIALPLSS